MDTRTRRSRGSTDRDREALDNIAALLNEPLVCLRSELPAHDREAIEQIAAFVAATGR